MPASIITPSPTKTPVHEETTTPEETPVPKETPTPTRTKTPEEIPKTETEELPGFVIPLRTEIGLEAIIGGLAVIGAVLAWYMNKRKKSRLKLLFDRVDKLYLSFKENTAKCESALYELRDLVASELKNGKIDEASFQILDNRIDKYINEVKKNKKE